MLVKVNLTSLYCRVLGPRWVDHTILNILATSVRILHNKNPFLPHKRLLIFSSTQQPPPPLRFTAMHCTTIPVSTLAHCSLIMRVCSVTEQQSFSIVFSSTFETGSLFGGKRGRERGEWAERSCSRQKAKKETDKKKFLDFFMNGGIRTKGAGYGCGNKNQQNAKKF